jgi:hypothetical protein
MGKKWNKIPPLFDEKDLNGITQLRDLDVRGNIPTHLAPIDSEEELEVDRDNVKRIITKTKSHFLR